jgi:hypothetical protein
VDIEICYNHTDIDTGLFGISMKERILTRKTIDVKILLIETKK